MREIASVRLRFGVQFEGLFADVIDTSKPPFQNVTLSHQERYNVTFLRIAWPDSRHGAQVVCVPWTQVLQWAPAEDAADELQADILKEALDKRRKEGEVGPSAEQAPVEVSVVRAPTRYTRDELMSILDSDDDDGE